MPEINLKLIERMTKVQNYSRGFHDGRKAAVLDKKDKSICISEILEDVKEEMCDKYCKYPESATQEYITESDDSPCNTCPLNRL